MEYTVPKAGSGVKLTPPSTQSIHVYYATTRPEDAGNTRVPLRFGRVAVDVPYGSLDKALNAALDKEDVPSPNADATLLLEEWVRDLSGKNILVYVHGFATTWASSVRGAVQIQVGLCRDSLTNFDITVVLFSWPSIGELLSYGSDEAMASHCSPMLADILRHLENVSTVSVMCHSMGNFVLECSTTRIFESEPQLRLRSLISVAGDIGSNSFSRDGGELYRVSRLFQHRIVFYHHNDVPLSGSRQLLHGTSPRLGHRGCSDDVWDVVQYECSGLHTFSFRRWKFWQDDRLRGHSYQCHPKLLAIVRDTIHGHWTIHSLGDTMQRNEMQRQQSEHELRRAIHTIDQHVTQIAEGHHESTQHIARLAAAHNTSTERILRAFENSRCQWPETRRLDTCVGAVAATESTSAHSLDN